MLDLIHYIRIDVDNKDLLSPTISTPEEDVMALKL